MMQSFKKRMNDKTSLYLERETAYLKSMENDLYK